MEMPLYLTNNYISTAKKENIFLPFNTIIQIQTGYSGNLYLLDE